MMVDRLLKEGYVLIILLDESGPSLKGESRLTMRVQVWKQAA